MTPELEQKAISFGISPEEEIFEEGGKLIYSISAINKILSNIESNITSLNAEFLGFKDVDNSVISNFSKYAISSATLIYDNGKQVTKSGTCFIGGKLKNVNQPIDPQLAINISMARAVRSALNSIGFNATDALLHGRINFKSNSENPEMKFIHLVKNKLDLDDNSYRRLLKSLTGKTTTKEMNIDELSLVSERFRLLMDGI